MITRAGKIGITTRFLSQIIVVILVIVLVGYMISFFVVKSHHTELLLQQKLGQNWDGEGSGVVTGQLNDNERIKFDLNKDEDLISFHQQLQNEILSLKNELKMILNLLVSVNDTVQTQDLLSSVNDTVQTQAIFSIQKQIGELKELEIPEESDLFSLRAEIDQLKNELHSQKIIEKDEQKVEEDNLKYLMMIPGFGPVDQYSGMIDSLFLSKKFGRVFATPDFFLHTINDVDSIRSFDLTFQREPLNGYFPTISLQEYSKRCNGLIDSLIWPRNPDVWKHIVKIYLKHADLSFTNVIYTPDKKDIRFLSEEALTSYFAKVSHQKCIALLFPHATVYNSEERASISKYLHHSKYIKDIVTSVFNYMSVTPDKLFTIHWRYGKECALYGSPNPKYDFCWGNSYFYYANSTEVLLAIINEIKSSSATHVYLAVYEQLKDPEILKKMENEFKASGIKCFRAQDIPLLRSITDSYYISIIEHEIILRSRAFCRSDSSTWSGFIDSWIRDIQPPTPTNTTTTTTTSSLTTSTTTTTTTTTSIGEVLKKNNYHYDSWNKATHEQQLKEHIKKSNR